MALKRLGRTGLQVSPLCFGTMSFGGDADRAESARLYAACRDRGVSFFDCADVYQHGLAEEILGDLIRGERDQLVITSKVGKPFGADPNARGTGRRRIIQAVEASLRRLKTDRIDIYFLHMEDSATPLEETLRALETLVTSGKVLHLGASNFAAWRIATALGVADRRGWAPIEVLQPMYSLVKRQAEVEILPLAAAEDLGVVSYSPLAAGLLSGKFRRDSRPNAGRLITDRRYAARYGEAWVHETAAAFVEAAEAMGAHPATLAVAWAAGHPAVTCPIIGARSVAQLEPALAALEVALTPDQRAEISALSRTPPPATDRLEEAGGAVESGPPRGDR